MMTNLDDHVKAPDSPEAIIIRIGGIAEVNTE